MVYNINAKTPQPMPTTERGKLKKVLEDAELDTAKKAAAAGLGTDGEEE